MHICYIIILLYYIILYCYIILYELYSSPPEYPFKPLRIVFLTPSARFETNTKVCLIFSAFHPELWQPAWGIRLTDWNFHGNGPTGFHSPRGYHWNFHGNGPTGFHSPQGYHSSHTVIRSISKREQIKSKKLSTSLESDHSSSARASLIGNITGATLHQAITISILLLLLQQCGIREYPRQYMCWSRSLEKVNNQPTGAKFVLWIRSNSLWSKRPIP
jgi:hypothetical protein